MEKTVCELFAGVGGFRCGLGDSWRTVWFNQWEPNDKRLQYAHGCYVLNFGACLNKNGADETNIDIAAVDKAAIPDFNLLVGGFPCQDYSVASTLKNAKGLNGKHGVLWWPLLDVIRVKQPPFILLENVDRLLKSPAKQRGRDFGVILACLRDEGYRVEWRVVNAAEYGLQQRRRRVFIFAYKGDAEYGLFDKAFPADAVGAESSAVLPTNLGEVSAKFQFGFENAGTMRDGVVRTRKVAAKYTGEQRTLGGLLETAAVAERYFVPYQKLYYAEPSVTASDESRERLPIEARQTWQYIKGSKKFWRTAANGHEYLYSEGAVPMIDTADKPARTLLTSEGNFGRSTHLVEDKATGHIRLLTPEEAERIQGFPTGHTARCLAGGAVLPVPERKRFFLMGNALVVDVIKRLEPWLATIVGAA